MKMTLDEAIVHAKELSESQSVCEDCREEHKQLADWLKELKQYKEEKKAINKQCKELGWLEDEKQETKQETNFEHYKDEIRDADFDFAVRDGKVIPCDGCPCSECLFFGNHTSCSVLRIEWLYQKYQRKYKLTQFEYDLIKAFDRCKECCLLNEIECLKKLSEKGYFKGIDSFTKVHDIIDNCEVIK